MPAEAIAARLPAGLGLEPDLFEGKAWLSVVALTLGHMRPGFLPRALGTTSHELNVRTYVRRSGEPGIWFFSMDTTSRAVALGSRALYGLGAHHAEVRLEREPYVWTARRGDLRFRAEFAPDLAVGVDLFRGHLRRATPPVVQGDGRRTPFREGTFDLVLVRHVLQAVPDPVAILREARRVLRPGGRIHLLVEDYSALLFDIGLGAPSRQLHDRCSERGGCSVS